jgi:N-acetyl-anhydromuramyl-L-alanine amidase AmpD
MYSRLNSSSHGCYIQTAGIAPAKSTSFVEPEQNEQVQALETLLKDCHPEIKRSWIGIME